MTRRIRRGITLAAIGAAGAAAITVGLAAPNLAFAQDPTPSPSATTSADPGKADRDAKRAQRHDELAAALAKELGIEKNKVAAALAKIESERAAARPDGTKRDGNKLDRTAELKTRLDAAVAAGKLTQAEADAILKAAEAGVLLGGGPHR